MHLRCYQNIAHDIACLSLRMYILGVPMALPKYVILRSQTGIQDVYVLVFVCDLYKTYHYLAYLSRQYILDGSLRDSIQNIYASHHRRIQPVFSGHCVITSHFMYPTLDTNITTS